MHIVSTYLPPTAASHAVKCNLGDDLLVVARINRLDLYMLRSTGIQHVSSLELLPRVVALHEISPEDGVSALLAITDHPDCSALVLEYSPKQRNLVVSSSQKLVLPYGRPLSGCVNCAISPDGRHAAIALFQGTMTILSFTREKGVARIARKVDSAIRELLLLSFAFLPLPAQDGIAISLLHKSYTGSRHISTRGVDLDTLDISAEGSSIELREEDEPTRMICVPRAASKPGGLLLFGPDCTIFYQADKLHKMQSPAKSRRTSTRQPDLYEEWKYSDVSGYGFIDESRLLLSDKYGKLVLLALDNDPKKIPAGAINIHLLGEASAGSCIAYLNAGVIFIGSETGDSQLMKITSSGKLEVIDTFSNTAPIADAVLADLDNTGDHVVVTCSGNGRSGSLRTIRSGANIEELASMETSIPIKNIFPLQETSGTSHLYMLISYDQETKLVDAREAPRLSELSAHQFPGVAREFPTLAAGNVRRTIFDTTTLAVQVTTRAAILFDVQSGAEYCRWSGSITTASVSGDAVCLGLRGGKVIALKVDIEAAKLVTQAERNFDKEISTLSIEPIQSGEVTSNVVVIGFWEDFLVKICQLHNLAQVGEDIETPHTPHSVLAWNFGDRKEGLYLLVGTGNGHILSVKLKETKNRVLATSRRTVVLGDRPVLLHRCSIAGAEVIMATGSRAMLLSWSNGRIAQHHVNIKNIESVAPFTSSAFGDALIFKLTKGLSIARIGKLEKLKIDSVSLGYDVPNTLAYHPDIKAFAVGCLRTEPSLNGASDNIGSSFKLIDALTFEFLNSHSFPPNEEVTKVIVGDLVMGDKQERYIIVGTAIWEDEEGSEPTKGRILLFRASLSKGMQVGSGAANAPPPVLTLVLEQDIPGSAVGLAVVDHRLAIIVNTIVVVYELRRTQTAQGLELKAVDQWIHNYAIWSIVPAGDSRVVIGDALQSATTLRWNGTKLEVVAKDWTTVNSLNVTADETYVIQSDIDGNLMSYKPEPPILQQTGHYHFGETISCLVPGSIRSRSNQNGSIVAAKHVLLTPGGRISLIQEILDEEKEMTLLAIERNMSAALKAERDHYDVGSWRAPHVNTRRVITSEEPLQSYGFLDGDILSHALELDPDSEMAKRLLSGSREAEKLDMTFSEVRGLLEEVLAV